MQIRQTSELQDWLQLQFILAFEESSCRGLGHHQSGHSGGKDILLIKGEGPRNTFFIKDKPKTLFLELPIKQC